MIGFKELVQNFKDGLPELKDIGKEGLGILGDCAKVAGEFALEGAKAAGNFAADGAKYALGSGGLKLTESNERTVHEYTDWTLDDVLADWDYRSMFKDAMMEIAGKRTYDEYVTACIDRDVYSASVLAVLGNRVLWLLHFKGIKVNAGTEFIEVSRNVRLLINTPNARQLSWDGQALEKGYTVEHSGHRGSGRRSEKKDVVLNSFLGVAFGRDYHEFATANQVVSPYPDLVVKDVEAVGVKSNVFLNFTGYRAIIASSPLVPEWKNKIIGVVCTIDPSTVGDIPEFFKKVRAILKHKYHGSWVEKNTSCGLLGLGTKYLYDSMCVTGGKIYLTPKDGVHELKAVSAEYGRYRSAVDAAYRETAEYKQKVAEEQAKAAEKERIENERRAEKERREKARQDAIALKEKQRAEEIAAERAAQKAELSNALDAL